MKVKNNVVSLLWQWSVIKYIALIIVFLVPLYFNNKYEIFVFGSQKTILTIGLVLLMTLFYLIGKLSDLKSSFKITYIHIVLTLFLFILTISSILGIDPHNSFFGTWREGINLLLIYSLTLFSFLIGFIINKDNNFVRQLLLYSFLSSIIVALISYTDDYFFKIFRDGGATIGNSSYAGAYLIFNICFGIGLFFYYKKLWKKSIIAIGILLISLSPLFFNINIFFGKVSLKEINNNPIVLFGVANGATIGLLVSFLVITIFLLIFSSRKILKITGFILFITLLSSIFYIGIRLVNSESSLHQVYLETKGGNRFIAWDSARQSFWDHPILGSGFNNFSYNYQKYFTPDIYESNNPEPYFRQTHNIILEYASNSGVLGLISFLSLLFFVFISLFQIKKEDEKRDIILRIVLIGSLFGYFIQNLFVFDTPATYMILFLLIGIAIGINKKEITIIIQDKYDTLIKILLLLFIIINLFFIFIFTILPLVEYRMWGSIGVDKIKDRINTREKVQQISLMGGISDSAYLSEYFFDVYKNNFSKINDNNKDEYLAEIDSVINQLNKDLEKQPYEIRAYIILSKIYNLKFLLADKFDEESWNNSYNNIQKALSINQKNSEIYLLLSQLYILKKDYNTAINFVRQAIIMNPTISKYYDFSKKLLKLSPNKEFEKYITEMEAKWVINK